MNVKAAVFSLTLVALGVVACGKSEPTPASPPADQTNAASTSGNPLTAPVDYLGAVGNAAKHSVKVVDTVQVQQAIRQFQAAEDRYPKDLQELIKEGYLVKLPVLPSGMEYDYDPGTGRVKAVQAKRP